MPKEIFGPDYPFLPPSELLTYDEIERIAKLFVSLGVEKIRLTGGEPLLRKDLPFLIERLVSLEGLHEIALTTNGFFLPKYANDLKIAGLKRVNISLDSMDDQLFGQMNGRNVGITPALNGIEAAKKAGLGIKINMVIKKGVNDSEIIPMATYCKENKLELRFIEYMDVGSTNGWKMKDVITKKEVHGKLQEYFDIEPVEADYFGEVAKKYRYKDSDVLVGFITSVSESFCSSCTRARLSANGHLYTCLFNGNGHNIRDLMRQGADDHTLHTFIKNIWEQRKDRYSDERTEETVIQQKKIEMSYIGG